ncbi:MAG TPA: hypothetical protein VMV51_09890 [Gemmatimonadaceae bacterium]|nr:hypothetical protein [Gemmatimonadaceae bacterium]
MTVAGQVAPAVERPRNETHGGKEHHVVLSPAADLQPGQVAESKGNRFGAGDGSNPQAVAALDDDMRHDVRHPRRRHVPNACVGRQHHFALRDARARQ